MMMSELLNKEIVLESGKSFGKLKKEFPRKLFGVSVNQYFDNVTTLIKQRRVRVIATKLLNTSLEAPL